MFNLFIELTTYNYDIYYLPPFFFLSFFTFFLAPFVVRSSSDSVLTRGKIIELNFVKISSTFKLAVLNIIPPRSSFPSSS